MPSYILSIDQGTSGTKAVIFDENGRLIAKGAEPLKSYYPVPGFVEQDPLEIYENVRAAVKACLEDLEKKIPGGIAHIQTCGISNQRETFVLWEKGGQPLANAVVWQCKRSVSICERLNQDVELANEVQSRTGLIIDPYFSATKLIWLYENKAETRRKVDNGAAYFGTIDTWLLYKLTQGKSYKTDHTNASRTLLFNLKNLEWDKNLLRQFGLDNLNLPDVYPSTHAFGYTDFGGLLAEPIIIGAMVGDSHAAAFGEGCFEAGAAKATLGTGCSMLWNTGHQAVFSKKGMMTTICWSTDKEINYALEGVIVSSGATIEWLKNQLGLFEDSIQTESMAQAVPDNGGVYLIPAFSGLGAPHWQPARKASIVGLTFNSNKNHLVRAALESVTYQIKDVIESIEQETGISLQSLKVDGGISRNQFVMDFLANLLQKEVVNIGMTDLSALGAAFLAGLQAGVFRDLDHLLNLKFTKKVYVPDPSEKKYQDYYEGWKEAIG